MSNHIDDEAINQLEQQVGHVSGQLNQYIQSLQMQVNQCTEVTQKALAIHSEASLNVAQAVQQAISTTSQMFRLCDQLDREMQGIEPLREQIPVRY
ncbi:hypothetical protein H4R33_006430 [Dimargaris cristalligena]|nr:hypothetical protein H4R33_006430 [Dimargaris cristalligena]